MTTSGVSSSNLTAGDIINTALELIGVLPANKTASADDAALGLKHLNWMLKSMQADGAALWRRENVTMTWPASTPDGLLSVNCMDVYDVRRQQADGSEISLMRVEQSDYNAIINKSQSGLPTTYSDLMERDDMRVRLWPVSSTDITIVADIERVIEDVTALTQTIDIPQAWLEACFKNLAAKLVPIYGLAADPNSQIIVQDAARLYQMMKNAVMFDSVYFQPG